jgi:hypothetical protein
LFHFWELIEMAGHKKPGPKRKEKKARKGKLTAAMIMRGKAAKIRHIILPV